MNDRELQRAYSCSIPTPMKPSRSLIAGGVCLGLMTAYTGAYWDRLPTVGVALQATGTFAFPSSAETAFFTPALCVHALVHPQSWASRIQGGMIRDIDSLPPLQP